MALYGSHSHSYCSRVNCTPFSRLFFFFFAQIGMHQALFPITQRRLLTFTLPPGQKKKKGYPIPWTARKMALTPSSVASCSSPRGLTRIMKEPVPTCPEAFYRDSLKSYLLHDTLQMAWSGALSCSLPSRCGVSSSIIACGTVFSTEHKLLSPASLESELLGSESGSATYCYDSLCKLLNPLSIK